MILNPFIYQSGGGGSGPILLVTVTGATATSVTAVNGGQSVSLAYDNDVGKWWAVLPSTGTWTVTAYNGASSSSSTTVSASSVTVYDISMQLRNLPSGYTELEYIESSGTQYINTGLSMKNGFRIKITCEFLSYSSQLLIIASQNTSQGWSMFCGYGWSGTHKALQVSAKDSYDYTQNTQFSLNTQYLLEASNLKGSSFIKAGGVTLTSTNNAGNNTNDRCEDPLYLFASNTNGTPYFSPAFKMHGKAEIYSSQLDNDLVSTMYPAKRNSDSAIGVYDVTRNSFYENLGTDPFIAGPEV